MIGCYKHIAAALLLVLADRGEGSAQTAAIHCNPTVLNDVVVETSRDIRHAGKQAKPAGIVGPTGFDWNDTPLGVVKSLNGSGFLFFGSDGSCHGHCNRAGERDGSITKTIGTLSAPLGVEPPSETVLPESATLPAYMLYTGGGPVYRVPSGAPGAGTLLLVYQAARASYRPHHQYPDCHKNNYCNGDQNGFYSYLGLAKSMDDGGHWTDLGLIIGAHYPYNSQLSFDIGDGNLVVHPADSVSGKDTGKFFYVYFPDRIDKATLNGMSVARVSYNDLLNAVVSGSTVPAFHKFYKGAWTEPGVGSLTAGTGGGNSTNLLDAGYGDPNVAWNNYLKRYVAVFYNGSTIIYAESRDGLTWTQGTTIFAPPASQNASILYSVLVGEGADPSILDQTFYVYYNVQTVGDGWDSAELKRLEVECR